MDTFSAITNLEETRQLKSIASDFVRSQKPLACIPTDKQKTHPDLAMILDAHNRNLDRRAVQFLPKLCFPLEKSRDQNGLRFVLWKPVIEFLQTEFDVEIEEWLCHDEVALLYLPNEAAEFAGLIYPKIEEGRQRIPFRREGAAFKVAFNSFCEIELALKQTDSPAAEIASRIHHKLSSKPSQVRTGHAPDLTKLIELASNVPAWAVQNCLDFLRQVQNDIDEAKAPLQLASESTLAKDWMSSEEDAAWRNL